MTTKINILILALGGASALQAAIDVNLPGNSEQSVWQNMNSTTLPPSEGYNGFFTNTAGWTTPVSPDNGSALFDKVPGTGGFPSTSSIYNFDTPGTFTVSDSDPIAGLQTVIFQTDMVGPMFSAPTFSYNGGNQQLAWDGIMGTEGDFSGMGANSTLYVYQWDLSAIVEEITSYEIIWTSGVHGSNYLMQINAGDTYTEVVPEPSTYALIAGLACAGLLLMRRRRR